MSLKIPDALLPSCAACSAIDGTLGNASQPVCIVPKGTLAIATRPAQSAASAILANAVFGVLGVAPLPIILVGAALASVQPIDEDNLHLHLWLHAHYPRLTFPRPGLP
ncbi:uncharacterized protein N7496_010864 [Penicillium cataractarum]|uniref:Uncharacterized protein n=1 Tax=Penicillium cataractarum TaxID=2100454 RepID=A0A9W9UXH8_9EURO|nr:uncharacterized protein N7496_010864 [Penicillium cataractarum]KAJ5358451.1 hypothetical protein N7496_010864 [Penicillium cataractarum]